VAGVASATVANVGVGASGDEDRWFPESGLCSHRFAVHGPVDPVLPTRSAGVSMDLNKYTPAKECRPARGHRGYRGGELPAQP